MVKNALLKYFALNHTFNNDTLDIYNAQLNELGQAIHEKRNDFLEVFTPIFKERYKAISNGNEIVNLSYKSDLFDDTLSTLLKTNLNKDKALQYTSVGIHKDDLLFKIDDFQEGFDVMRSGQSGKVILEW